MENRSFAGSCLCGAVAYEISPPFLFFHHCHCSRCRKLTGSAYAANIFLKVDQFRWTKGEDLVGRYELPEAEHYCSGFCTVCGARLPWISRNRRYVLVPAGTLDEDPGARPTRNVFWGSRAPWHVSAESLPTFEERPRK